VWGVSVGRIRWKTQTICKSLMSLKNGYLSNQLSERYWKILLLEFGDVFLKMPKEVVIWSVTSFPVCHNEYCCSGVDFWMFPLHTCLQYFMCKNSWKNKISFVSLRFSANRIPGFRTENGNFCKCHMIVYNLPSQLARAIEFMSESLPDKLLLSLSLVY
jgi:hypothetical protein